MNASGTQPFRQLEEELAAAKDTGVPVESEGNMQEKDDALAAATRLGNDLASKLMRANAELAAAAQAGGAAAPHPVRDRGPRRIP